MTTYVTSSADELIKAIDQAEAGDRIKLKGGHYEDFYLRDKDFASGVEIVAHNPKDPPVFSTIKLSNVSGLTFNGINIDFEPDESTVEWDAAFRADNCSNISIVNSALVGGESVGGISPDSKPGDQGASGVLGEPIATGINFQRSDNILIENTKISEFTAGIRANRSDGLSVKNVEIFDVGNVPIGGADTNNVLIEESHFHDIHPWNFSAEGDHGDHIHFWTTPENDGPNYNYVIRNNFFEQGDGEAILGIYLDDNRNDIGFRDVLIEGNVIHNSNARSILLEDVADAVIRKNTLLQKEGDPSDAPQIYLADGTGNILIQDNILSGITGPVAKDLAGNNIRLENNLSVQIHSPFEDGYASNLLRDPFSASPKFEDLTALPGGPAEGFGPNELEDIPSIRSMAKAGLETGTFAFNVVGTSFAAPPSHEAANENGPLVTSVEWDFGDGATSKGLSVEHNFTTAGSYTVSARLTYEDGSTEDIVRTVNAFTPIAIDMNFASGFEDRSDIANQITTSGDVELVASSRGKVARIASDSSTIDVQQGVELGKNQSFSIAFGFNSPDSLDDWGRALHFSSVAVIDIKRDYVRLQAKSDEDEKVRILADNLSLDDGNWHHLVYTFDAEAGLAELFLDGLSIGSADGIAGNFAPNGSRPLSLGNPYGSGFNGLMDDLVFVRSSLDADNISKLYENFSAHGDIRDIVFKPRTEEVVEEEPVVERSGFFHEETLVVQTGVTHTVDQSLVKEFLIGTDNFNLSFDINQNSAGESGEILRYGTSFITEVKNGELVIRAETEDAQMVSFTTEGAGLDLTGEHSVSISLVGGVMSANVNGTTVGATEMPSSVTVNGWDGHDLHIGNPWSNDSYEAVLSNLTIVDVAERVETPQDESHDTVKAAFQVRSQDGEAGLRVFDGRLSTVGGAELPEDASYVWTFADGATAEGAIVARTYNEATLENVHLDITLAGGKTSQTSQAFEIAGPDLVGYSAGQDFVMYDGRSIEDDDLTTAGLDISASGVALEVNDERLRDLVGADEFNFSFGLQSDTSFSAGEVFRYGTSLVVTVTDDGELALQANTDDGRVQLRTPEVDLSDMLAHDVEITFKNDRLGISVDGALEAEAEMKSGLSATGSHGIYFGNPWGRDNFEGLLDAFELTVEQSDFERAEIFEMTAAELDLFV